MFFLNILMQYDKNILILLIIIHCSHLIYSQDTFSIIAVDTISGKIGSAGASCVQNSIIISDMHPGIGAIHTQSYWNEANQDSAGYLMEQGFAPNEIISWLLENDSENNPTIRQYGVVDILNSGRSAAYTGEDCFDYKNHIIGETYSIQGNILLGQEILDSMENAFLNTYGTFEEKLMSSLMSANIIGADTRCSPYGTPAISAFIRISNPDDQYDSLYMDLNVGNAPLTINPLDSLNILYWNWKEENYILGDINYDYIVNIADVIILSDFLDGTQSIDQHEIAPADINMNDEIELTDIFLLIFNIIGIVGL